MYPFLSSSICLIVPFYFLFLFWVFLLFCLFHSYFYPVVRLFVFLFPFLSISVCLVEIKLPSSIWSWGSNPSQLAIIFVYPLSHQYCVCYNVCFLYFDLLILFWCSVFVLCYIDFVFAILFSSSFFYWMNLFLLLICLLFCWLHISIFDWPQSLWCNPCFGISLDIYFFLSLTFCTIVTKSNSSLTEANPYSLEIILLAFFIDLFHWLFSFLLFNFLLDCFEMAKANPFEAAVIWLASLACFA